MGVFSKKQNTEEQTPEVAKVDVQAATKTTKTGEQYALLSKPRVTEKATTLATVQNVYVFDIAPYANKIMIANAVKELYKVTPVKVNIVAIPKKQVFTKRIKGMKGGGKKAYVFLKKGDTIELA